MSEPIDANTITSHEDARGRVLTGVGVSADRLADTMERHAPPDPVSQPTPAPSSPVPDSPAAPAAPEQPPVSRGRQRFADLTKERDDARAEAAAAKAEAAAAKAEREAARAPVAPEPARPAEPVAPVKVTPTRAQPTEDEIGTKYSTYAEFVVDLTRWVNEQDRAQQTDPAEHVREVLARERARDDFQTAVRTSQDRARKAYPDFDALLSGPAGQIALGRTREEAIERVAFIAKHPQSEHIQYAMLKDAALAERLRDSDPYTFGETIASLVPTAKPAAPAWTPPPPPNPIVGASTPVTTKASSELTKGFDFDKSGFREQRDRELGRKPKRW